MPYVIIAFNCYDGRLVVYAEAICVVLHLLIVVIRDSSFYPYLFLYSWNDCFGVPYDGVGRSGDQGLYGGPGDSVETTLKQYTGNKSV